MSIIPAEKYPGKTAGKSAEYPLGKARNISSTGDGSGTPLEQAWVNDLFGFQQAILKAADIVASGAPDTAQNSQVLEAMRKLFSGKTETSELMEKLKVQVGEYIFLDVHMGNAAAVAAYKGYGVWERALQGRVAVGFSDNPDDIIEFRTHGAEYGENEHTLTVEESASHNHNDGTFDRLLTASGANTASGSDPTPGHVSVHGGGGKIQPVGGNQPHNNIQQSKTIDVWLRVG